MQFKQITFFTILSLLLLSGCSKSDNEDKNIVEKKQKEITYKLTTTKAKTLHITAANDTLDFKEFKDKAVLLVFFATWCPPCIAEIPHLNNLQEKYKNNFKIIAILIEDKQTSPKLKAFIRKNNINYTITNSEENYILAKALGGIKTIPTMFMYNKNGELLEKYIGIVPQEMLEMDIKKAIK